tara:strand:- start:307 stop:615 length:309 start_codon:yes stop_codon:yes gene_type:complete
MSKTTRELKLKQVRKILSLGSNVEVANKIVYWTDLEVDRLLELRKSMLEDVGILVGNDYKNALKHIKKIIDLEWNGMIDINEYRKRIEDIVLTALDDNNEEV